MSSASRVKRKYAATELKERALRCEIEPCEMRAFVGQHEETLGVANHAAFVEAFVLQLGSPDQHFMILGLLADCGREFKSGKIAYKPPSASVVTSILEVARWVSGKSWMAGSQPQRCPLLAHISLLYIVDPFSAKV